MTKIHPTAIVHPKVKIHKSVRIGAYSVLNSPNITLDEGVEIKNHAVIEGHVHIKKNTTICSFVSIGGAPQNIYYAGEESFIEIGENCHIREYVSINSSCGEGEKLVIGNKCYIMTYCHIAHNCILGNNVVMANNATLGGHVIVGDHANLGGLCAIHQKCRIGNHAMVGGGAMVGTDVPPFCLGSGYPIKLSGLNWIGLKRNGISREIRKGLIRTYRLTLLSGLSWKLAREEIIKTVEMNPLVQKWIDFCDESKRGLTPARDKRLLNAVKKNQLIVNELVEIG